MSATANSSPRQPVFFLSHGGGPWPWLDGPYRAAYDKLQASLQALPASLPAPPRAVLLLSAHWEAPAFALSAAEQPGMLYDYGGFPPHTYQIAYPAPGAPQLAQQVQEMLQQAGLPAALDTTRGYDHGTFVPAAAIWPQAQMPILQMSLLQGLDVEQHLRAGQALAPLRDQGVLMLASGLSYHNLRQFGPAAQQVSASFDAWLQQVCAQRGPARAAAQRARAQAPKARTSHPPEEQNQPLKF